MGKVPCHAEKGAAAFHQRCGKKIIRESVMNG